MAPTTRPISRLVMISHQTQRNRISIRWSVRGAFIAMAIVIGSLGLASTSSSQVAAQDSESDRPVAEDMLPNTTKAVFVIRDFDEMSQKLEATQLGALFEQEELEPFVTELRRVIETQLTDANTKLGFEVADIQGIRSGEVTFASILPEPEGHAVVALIDAQGNEGAARELMGKIRARLVGEGAKELDPLTEVEITITDIEMPLKRGEAVIEHVYFALANGFLISADHEVVVRSLVRSVMDKQGDDFESLTEIEAYKSVQDRLAMAEGNPESDMRWFVEPFGLARAIRNAIPPDERGQNIMSILEGQGFDAVKGIGGDISISAGPFELMHRSFVFAPRTTEEGEDTGIRYSGAARALKFENGPRESLHPYPFLLPDTATYVTFNWDMPNAFNSLGSLVDEIIDSPGAFDRMLQEMEHALDGPKVDILGSLVSNFEPRLTMVSDITKPITLDSERVMMVIRVRNSEEVAAAVAKIMDVEPFVEAIEYNDVTIWEKDLSPQQDSDIPSDIPDFNPFEVQIEEEEPVEDESLAGWNSFCVADGFLLISNNVELIKQVLDADGSSQLVESADFQRMEKALSDLIGDEASFSQFGRLDEVLRVTYELLRQGKMPEAQSLLGEVLNRRLGSGEAGVVRDQQIDPSSLPADDESYDRLIAPFIGPSGWSGKTEENGYFITGGILPKATDNAAAEAIAEGDGDTVNKH